MAALKTRRQAEQARTPWRTIGCYDDLHELCANDADAIICGCYCHPLACGCMPGDDHTCQWGSDG